MAMTESKQFESRISLGAKLMTENKTQITVERVARAVLGLEPIISDDQATAAFVVSREAIMLAMTVCYNAGFGAGSEQAHEKMREQKQKKLLNKIINLFNSKK